LTGDPISRYAALAEIALGHVHRAAIEEGTHQVQIEAGEPAAAGHALVGPASQRVALEPAGDPEPDLVDTEALVDRELVQAAAGPDHLDDEVGTVFDWSAPTM